jgi:MFS family permease
VTRDTPWRLTVLISALVFFDLLLWFAVVPLVPYWHRTIGMTKTQAGIVLGAYSAAVLVASLPAGHLADRFGPRRLTVAATLLFAVSIPPLALADAVWQLVLVRTAQGLSSAVAWTAGLAWLTASVPAGQRGRSVAIVNSVAAVAGLAGPAVGGPLVARVGLSAVCDGLALIVLGLFVIALLEPDPPRSEVAEPVSPLVAARLARRERRLLVALVGMLIVSAAAGTVQVLAPLHLSAEGVSQSGIGWIFTAGALGAGVVTFTVGRAAGRFDGGAATLRLIGAVAVAIALLALGLPLPAYVAVIMLLAAMQGGIFAVTYPLSADGADHAGIGQGVAMASMAVAWGIAALVSPIAASQLSRLGGDALAFAAVSLVALGTAVILHGAGARSTPIPSPRGDA